MSTPSLIVTAAGDRPTPRQRIEQTLEQDQQAGEPTRVRVPVHVYDRATRDYRQIPDMLWNLQFQDATADGIEAVFEALGKCLAAIGQHGADALIAHVGRLGEERQG